MEYNKLQKRQLVRVVKQKDQEIERTILEHEVERLKVELKHCEQSKEQELEIQRLKHELEIQSLKQETEEKGVKEVVSDIAVQVLAMVVEGFVQAAVLIFLLHIGINLI